MSGYTDDDNPSMVDFVPCLVEDRVKELHGKRVDQATKKELQVAREYVLKIEWATLLLIYLNHGRCRAMENQMQQNMVIGTNNYPKSVW